MRPWILLLLAVTLTLLGACTKKTPEGERATAGEEHPAELEIGGCMVGHGLLEPGEQARLARSGEEQAHPPSSSGGCVAGCACATDSRWVCR